MMSKILFFAACTVVLFAGNCAAGESDIELLQAEVEERMAKISQIVEKMKNTTNTYSGMAEERINSLKYLYTSIMKDIDKNSQEGVREGVQRRRWFMNYECLVNAVNKAKADLNKYYGNYPEDMEKLIEKNAATTNPFMVVAENLKSYMQELYSKKKKEIMGASDPAAVKKILEELAKDLKAVDQTFVDLESKIFKLTFAFFENFVNTSYSIESSLRLVPTQDIPKILKCMT